MIYRFSPACSEPGRWRDNLCGSVHRKPKPGYTKLHRPSEHVQIGVESPGTARVVDHEARELSDHAVVGKSSRRPEQVEIGLLDLLSVDGALILRLSHSNASQVRRPECVIQREGHVYKLVRYALTAARSGADNSDGNPVISYSPPIRPTPPPP